MIEVEMKYGEEEYGVLTDLLIDSAKGKKKNSKVGTVLFILAGLYLLFAGISGLFAAPVIRAICLILAVGAFFLAFGGERILLRSGVLRRTRKANEEIGGSRYYAFDENETRIRSDFGAGTYPWNAYTAWGEQSHYLWLRRQDNKYVLVDLKLLSAEDGALLRKYCGEKIH